MWMQRGGKLEHETETNMVWLDLEDVGLAEGDDGRGESGKGRRSKGFVEMAVERGVKVMGGRLVVHYRMLRLLMNVYMSGFGDELPSFSSTTSFPFFPLISLFPP